MNPLIGLSTGRVAEWPGNYVGKKMKWKKKGGGGPREKVWNRMRILFYSGVSDRGTIK